MKYARKMMLAVAVLAMVAVSAQAAVVTGVTIEDVSSEFSGRAAVNTINGSGFTEATGVHDASFTNMWMSNAELPCSITFDLEANYDLNDVTVWNFNEPGRTGRGAKAVEILIASSVGGAYTSLGTFEFSRAPGTVSNFGQVIDLTSYTAADDARLVRFAISTNWVPEGGDAKHTGLAEVRFDAVPEPATMSLLGIGGLLALVRRRRK